ncbi:hypothetical protein [Thalassotalea ganghwensis]
MEKTSYPSYLVELYLLKIHYGLRGTLPKLLGFAALLLTISHGQFKLNIVVNVIAITFLEHGLIAIVFSKGRHLPWLIFLFVAFILLYVAKI